jgi:SAM-dependent methyltransferase
VTIDPAAASFERVAADYELGRPSWPAAAVESVGLPRQAVVLDLGAGTGKLTRVLLERFARVIAVEPLTGMRELIPHEAEVLDGTAESIPLPDASVDGTFCGESFHWFDWARAVPEIARVLRTGAPICLLFNRGRHGFVPEIEAILERAGDSPGERRVRDPAWREAFVGRPFTELRKSVFVNEHDLTSDELFARIGSWSQFTTMAPAEREQVLAEIRSHLVDQAYHVRLETEAWTARRS